MVRKKMSYGYLYDTTVKDALCIFFILNLNKMFLIDLANILNYSHGTIKKKLNPLVERGILNKTYFRGKVVYEINTNYLNDLYRELMEYCHRNERRIRSRIELVKTSKGLLSTRAIREGERQAQPVSIKVKHREIQETLVKLGKALGYSRSRLEYEHYICGKIDVAWIKDEMELPDKIFEVQRHGILEQALTKLDCGYKQMKATPYIVIYSDKDLQEIKRLLKGSYTSIRNKLIILKAGSLLKLNNEEIIEVLSKLIK